MEYEFIVEETTTFLPAKTRGILIRVTPKNYLGLKIYSKVVEEYQKEYEAIKSHLSSSYDNNSFKELFFSLFPVERIKGVTIPIGVAIIMEAAQRTVVRIGANLYGEISFSASLNEVSLIITFPIFVYRKDFPIKEGVEQELMKFLGNENNLEVKSSKNLIKKGFKIEKVW